MLIDLHVIPLKVRFCAYAKQILFGYRHNPTMTMAMESVPHPWLMTNCHVNQLILSNKPNTITHSGLISHCFALHPYEKHGLIKTE